MSTSPALRSLLAVACVATLGLVAVRPPALFAVARHQQEKSQKADKSAQTEDAQDVQDSHDDANDEEAAPAAVDLDVSKDSPLIRELYQATRETKEKAILPHLQNAKKMVEDGADLSATDQQGRTALHWVIFGSSYNTKTSVVVAYEEIADAMLQRKIDVNREDVYQDTAFDYLVYSPNFEMQTLLLESGATSGFLAFYNFLNEQSDPTQPAQPGQAAAAAQQSSAAVAAMRKPDLSAGQTLSVRLDGPVYSDRSRTGDPMTATVTYPLCKNGEQIECNPGELLLPPGTKLNGTILFAQKAPDKYSRPRMVLDFANIVHANGQRSPLYARVLSVDNARETVRNNEILGIVQPHASTKVTVAMAALSAVNPIAGYTIKGVQTVYGLSIRREIAFPAGTDIQIQILRPSMIKQKDSWAGWQRLPVNPNLEHLAKTVPPRTTSKTAVASDPTNLLFIGSQAQVATAFGRAGWFEADNLGMKSAVKVATATLRQSGYGSAPVSTLLLEGRPPDLVFQKSLNTFAKRHHLRVWKLEKSYDGQDVWVAAATHDIETTSKRANTKWSHRIDSHVDRERDWVATDLLYIAPEISYVDIERPAAPHKIANATGDDIVTDGKISVLNLTAVKLPEATPATTAAAGAQ
jgi:LssY C-terminus